MNAHEDLLRKAKFDIEVGADGLWRIAGSKEDIKALSAVATSALAGAGDALVDSLDQMLAARWTLNDEPLPEDVAGVLRAVASRLAAPSKEAGGYVTMAERRERRTPEQQAAVDAMRPAARAELERIANPPGDQRQEGECNCHEGNGARNCLIHTQADFDAQQSPPPEAAAAVGEGPHEELCEELLALAEWEFNAECCNSTFPINMLRRVCEEAAAALVAPTGPQPAGGGVGNRPSPQALHEAFYERTLPGLSPREFAVMVKIEDRAHAIDKGDSHAG